MAVTRRQFITTLGTLAAAMGIGQAEIAKVTEAFALGAPWTGGTWGKKPKVVWVHGAECTGCSTSLLSFFEDAAGVAVPGTALGDVTSGQALGFINTAAVPTADAPVVGAGLVNNIVTSLAGARSLGSHSPASLNVDGSALAVNIADVLIDFIDLQYHETVMGQGGDAAYSFLKNEMVNGNDTPFVLVCEGAAQFTQSNGYWGADGDVPWCSIAADGGGGSNPEELAFPDVVHMLAKRASAIISIGQCAAFGGYPACSGPGLTTNGNGKNMTGAQGIYDFLYTHYTSEGDFAKVINVPGCPVNPWWFVLTVVAWLVDAVYVTAYPDAATGVLGILNHDLSINGNAVDGEGRLTAVYGDVLHSKYCPRYPKYAANEFASKPGDDGCMKNLGCKGLWTMSSCGRHGWNNAQPQNAASGMQSPVLIDADGNLSADQGTSKIPPLYTHTGASGAVTPIGGCCLTAGAPCMGCTEKGYPDAMTPFVVGR